MINPFAFATFVFSTKVAFTMINPFAFATFVVSSQISLTAILPSVIPLAIPLPRVPAFALISFIIITFAMITSLAVITFSSIAFVTITIISKVSLATIVTFSRVFALTFTFTIIIIMVILPARLAFALVTFHPIRLHVVIPPTLSSPAAIVPVAVLVAIRPIALAALTHRGAITANLTQCVRG